MKLSDVVGHSGLAIYAEIALILFIVAFIAIVVWLFWPGRTAEMETMRQLPLEDELRHPNSGEPS